MDPTNTLISQIEQIPEGQITITFDQMPDWWSSDHGDVFAQEFSAIFKRVREQFLVELPLQRVCVNLDVPAEAAQWQQALGLPVETSEGDDAIVGGKLFAWEHPTTKVRYGVIVLSDTVAIATVVSALVEDDAEKKQASFGPDTLIHELTHIVDKVVRHQYNEKDPVYSNDWPGIQRYVAECVWEEAFSEFSVEIL